MRQYVYLASIGFATLGGAFIALGSVVDGYLRDVLVNVGAAVLLLSPAFFAERFINKLLKVRVEDEISGVLNRVEPRGYGPPGAAAPPESSERYVSETRELLADVAKHLGYVVVQPAGDMLSDLILENGNHKRGVAIKATTFPLDATTIRRLSHELAARDHVDRVLIVSRSPLTQLARESLRSLRSVDVVEQGVRREELQRALSVNT